MSEGKFCRQCGTASTSASSPSELPTTAFGQAKDDPSTRRLNVRGTRPEQNFRANIAPAENDRPGEESQQKRWMPVALLFLTLALGAVGLVTWINFGRDRRTDISRTNGQLVYPGSKTIVDTTTDEGRAIQLQTSDHVEQVVAWYMANLKPTKTMRLTPTTVVLRNQSVTATVAAENNKTNILIKQAR